MDSVNVEGLINFLRQNQNITLTDIIYLQPKKELRSELLKSIDDRTKLARILNRCLKQEAAKSPKQEKDESIYEKSRIRFLLQKKKRLQNQRVIEESIRVQQKIRKQKWEIDMVMELNIMNEITRILIIDQKLRCPLPSSVTGVADENMNLKNTNQTISDLTLFQTKNVNKGKMRDLKSKKIFNWPKNASPTRLDTDEDIYISYQRNLDPGMAVIIEGKEFYCHCAMLALVSHFFFNRNFTRVLHMPTKQVTSQSFITIYRWILEPITVISTSQLLDLLSASQFLGIHDLSYQCWLTLHDLLKKSMDILSIYIQAQKSYPQIERIMMPHLSKIFMPFVASAKFANLDYVKVLRILKFDHLTLNNEMELFYTIIYWLSFDWDNRKTYLMELIKLIRFNMMPFLFLISFERRTDGPLAIEALKQSDIVREQIFEALCESRENPNKYIDGCGLYPRRFIYDPACIYHHSQKCKTLRFYSFEDYTMYLNYLQLTKGVYMDRILDFRDDSIECCSFIPDFQ